MARHGRQWPRSFVLGCGLAPLVVASVAIGGVHRETQAVLAGLWAIGLGSTLLVIPRKRLWMPRSAAWLACLVLSVGILQVLPLPPVLLATVAPRTADWYAFLFAPPGGAAAPDWRPLALAPPSAWAALVLRCGYLVQFLLLLRLFRPGGGHRWPLYCLVVLGVLSFGVGIVHTLAGAERILGLYAPRQAKVYPFLATFVNPNFQAAFYGMAGFVALGLSRSKRERGRRRLLLATAAVCCFVGVLLTLSRGGIVLLPPALLLYFALSRASDAKVGRALVAVVVALAALALCLDAAGVGKEIASLVGGRAPEVFSKAKLWPHAARLVLAFWPFGVGDGGFATSFSHFAPELGRLRVFLEPENLLLQVTSSYGLPAGVLVLMAGGWTLAACVKGIRLGRTSAGVVAALAFGVAHELADFSFSAPGIMLVVVTLVAFLWVRRREHERGAGHGPPGVYLGPVPAGLLLAACLVGSVTLARQGNATSSACAARLRTLAASGTTETEFVSEFSVARRRYPTYWYFYALRARHALLNGAGPAALHWVNRALFMHPEAALAHQLAAEALRAAGREKQATTELRLAVAAAATDEQVRTLLGGALKRGVGLDGLADLAGGDLRAEVQLLHVLVQRDRVDLALAAVERLGFEARAAGDEAAERMLANVLFTAGRFDELETFAAGMVERHPRSGLAWYWYARAARKREELTVARDRAQRGRDLATQPAVLAALIDEEAAACALQDDIEGLSALVGATKDAPQALPQIYVYLGRARSRRGETSRALAELHLAKHLRPEWAEPHLVIGRVLAKAGSWHLAAASFEEVLRLKPGDAEATAGLAQALRSIEAERRRAVGVKPGRWQ